MADTVIVGAGHNGLVAAVLLARAGRDVVVVERDHVIGGACRTEHPFTKVPTLGASTGAYLLGLMPPELLEELDLRLPLLRRDPHYFLPTLDDGYLLLGRDAEVNQAQLRGRYSDADAAAVARLTSELAALRDDLAPAWLRPPLPLEETAATYVRSDLQSVFLSLCRGTVRDHLDRVGLRDPALRAMFAVTDAFPGLHGGFDTPGSGFNLLVHNSGRLPGSDGTWMVVRGGMGTVTAALAQAAEQAGATIRTGEEVVRIELDADGVAGVRLDSGEPIVARTVLVNADPYRLPGLVGRGTLGELADRIDGYRRAPGTTLKLNLALARLPSFRVLPAPQGQHGTTIHLLPSSSPDPEIGVARAHAQAMAGSLPDDPPIEMYIHTAVDPSLQDGDGHHSAALFVQWVPNRPAIGDWDELGEAYADHLIARVERYAPGFAEQVVDRQVLHPAAIERHFGITGGNIFHVDNTFSFTDRLPYQLPVPGLYACGAGCHPAGSVIGAAGHNAAKLVLADG